MTLTSRAIHSHSPGPPDVRATAGVPHVVADEAQRVACLGLEVPVAPELDAVARDIVDSVVAHDADAAEGQLDPPPEPAHLVLAEAEGRGVVREDRRAGAVLVEVPDA